MLLVILFNHSQQQTFIIVKDSQHKIITRDEDRYRAVLSTCSGKGDCREILSHVQKSQSGSYETYAGVVLFPKAKLKISKKNPLVMYMYSYSLVTTVLQKHMILHGTPYIALTTITPPPLPSICCRVPRCSRSLRPDSGRSSEECVPLVWVVAASVSALLEASAADA